MTDSILEKGISGVEGLLKDLQSFDASMEKKFAVKANRAGAALYRHELRQLLRRSSGKAQRSWKTNVEGKKGQAEDVHLYNRIGIKKGKGRANINHRVGYVGLAKEYGHVLEYGSKHMEGNLLWTRTLKRMARQILDEQKKSLEKSIKEFGNGRS